MLLPDNYRRRVMEFFAKTVCRANPQLIQHRVRIENLMSWCAAIEAASGRGERGELLLPWGRFRVRREVIQSGVRFSLPGCPNATQWTITADQRLSGVRLHCTLNRTKITPDLRSQLEAFVAEWLAGLESGLQGSPIVRVGCEDAVCLSSFSGMG
ncbi:hypothetical protein Rifp1Sym_ak00040 [endosymbiont of Riftia pachyptila (vent Ph05)]|uniref:Uncharacterized protein n=2 Tax=endosymbiont of Riftia pachyptila TaxID=54396 RepID=G2DAI7_9GAMM|nr:hypothetical protein Rifp1Sym_ak00040 [endosymbiont of Riftia pachyptila (vent Ph05)]